MTIYMSFAHSPSFPSRHLRHNSFSNPSVALPMSQLILQPFFRFSYVTGSSLNSPGEPLMLLRCMVHSSGPVASVVLLWPDAHGKLTRSNLVCGFVPPRPGLIEVRTSLAINWQTLSQIEVASGSRKLIVRIDQNFCGIGLEQQDAVVAQEGIYIYIYIYIY